jgi:hypothetical protein
MNLLINPHCFTDDEVSTIRDKKISTSSVSNESLPRQKVLQPIQGPVMPIPKVRTINRIARDKRMEDQSETDTAEESASTSTDEEGSPQAAEAPPLDLNKISIAGMLNS